MKSLRCCRVCGFEAHSKEKLDKFIRDKRCFHDRQNICKVCWNEYNAKWKKTNNYRVVNTKKRRSIINGFKKPLICYFCDSKIIKTEGQTSDSLVLHSLDGNHENWNPENKAASHNGCHTAHHSATRLDVKILPKQNKK